MMAEAISRLSTLSAIGWPCQRREALHPAPRPPSASQRLESRPLDAATPPWYSGRRDRRDRGHRVSPAAPTPHPRRATSEPSSRPRGPTGQRPIRRSGSVPSGQSRRVGRGTPGRVSPGRRHAIPLPSPWGCRLVSTGVQAQTQTNWRLDL